MGKKKRKMRGIVEKIIRSVVPNAPEKAQISVEEADDLYREIRVENVVTDENGEKARLKPTRKSMSSSRRTLMPQPTGGAPEIRKQVARDRAFRRVKHLKTEDRTKP